MVKLLLPPTLLVVVLGIIALACVWTQEAWLAPSLAAAAFTQIFTPTQPGSKPYSIALGQVVGGTSGFIGVYAAHATNVAKFMGAHDLSYQRVLAVVIAVAITATVQIAIEAKSPAGGTTAVVVAIGVESADWAGVTRLAVGIALVTILGEIARRVLFRVDSRDATLSNARPSS